MREGLTENQRRARAIGLVASRSSAGKLLRKLGIPEVDLRVFGTGLLQTKRSFPKAPFSIVPTPKK